MEQNSINNQNNKNSRNDFKKNYSHKNLKRNNNQRNHYQNSKRNDNQKNHYQNSKRNNNQKNHFHKNQKGNNQKNYSHKKYPFKPKKGNSIYLNNQGYFNEWRSSKNHNVLKQKNNLNSLFLKSFGGMTLKEISDWYPISLDPNDVLEYMIQMQQYESYILSIKYDLDPKSVKNDYSLRLGLLTFCKVIDILSTRYAFAMYQSVDNYLENEENHKGIVKTAVHQRNMTYYNDKDYHEYLETSWDGKHFITPFEFKRFLKMAKTRKLNQDLLDFPWSVDSLFIVLYQHRKEFPCVNNYRTATDMIFLRNNKIMIQEGWKNDFLRFRKFLEKYYNKENIDTFSKMMICDHFFRSEYQLKDDQSNDDDQFKIDYDKIMEMGL